MPEEMNDFAGDSAVDNAPASDLGGEQPESTSTESLDHSGGEPESRVYDEEYVGDLRKQLSSLNKQVVDYRRQANANKPNPYQVNDTGTSSEGYTQAQSIKLARADLRDRVEGFLHLYPELPSDVANTIRKNPVAYVNPSFFDNPNVDNAALDVEVWVSRYVENMGASKPSPKTPRGKQVNPSQTPESKKPAPQEEEKNLWTILHGS